MLLWCASLMVLVPRVAMTVVANMFLTPAIVSRRDPFVSVQRNLLVATDVHYWAVAEAGESTVVRIARARGKGWHQVRVDHSDLSLVYNAGGSVLGLSTEPFASALFVRSAGGASMLDLETGNELASLSFATPLADLAASPLTHHEALAVDVDGQVYRWSGERLSSLGAPLASPYDGHSICPGWMPGSFILSAKDRVGVGNLKVRLGVL